MKAVHVKLYTVQPLHAQFIVYSVKCAVYSVYCTLYTVQYTPLHALDITGGLLAGLRIVSYSSGRLKLVNISNKPGVAGAFEHIC